MRSPGKTKNGDIMADLKGKNILFGVTGGIAAYKSAETVSALRHRGADIHVVMTENAEKFISPVTFQALSLNTVVTDTFQCPVPERVEHIALARDADIMVIAPATANIIAKIAHGIADDMLSSTVLAATCPILLAPAMNTHMWQNAATQANIRTLISRGILTVGPAEGILACGDTGPGRMSEPAEIVSRIEDILCAMPHDLDGMKVLVTAGGTRERLDPVRFLTNDSSGKMGFAIAEEARDRGAEVTLVYGNVSVPVPAGVKAISIESALDLYQVMMEECSTQDIIIQAAAVADYRFAEQHGQKMKRKGEGDLLLRLVENPDIAAAVGEKKKEGQILIGFAAETSDLTRNAAGKLKKKNLDMIVANDVTKEGAGFNTDTNIAVLITRDRTEERPIQSKRSLAGDILDRAVAMLKKN